MTQKDRSSLHADIGSRFTPLGTGPASEGDVHAVATDLADSAIFPEDIPLWAKDRPVMIVIAGQSNAQGVNAGGPNPASAKVAVWDGATDAWGSSDYTEAPMNRATPHGNGGRNNIGLALAHRFADDHDRKAYVIYDAAGGQSISAWIGNGTASGRYSALKAKIEAALATPEFAGITTPDMVFVWAQGEADFEEDFETYRDQLEDLIAQLRAESWFAETTPILLAEMSPLHTRYAPQAAQRHIGTGGDAWVQSVSSAGLATSDNTHWTGPALWEFGYYRMWQAVWSAPRVTTTPDPVFYTRLGAPAGRDDAIVVCAFDSLISAQADQENVSTGTIAWGYEVSVDGNYSVGFGYQTTIGNLSNYTFVSGRDSHATDNADYAFATGYQCIVDNDYAFAAGRGHTVTAAGGFAVGMFSEYTGTETDNVMLQVGIGTSSGNRRNGLTVRQSGTVETRHLPVHGDDAAAAAAGLTEGQWYRTATGALRIKL